MAWWNGVTGSENEGESVERGVAGAPAGRYDDKTFALSFRRGSRYSYRGLRGVEEG